MTVQTEHDEQKLLVKWFRLTHRNTRIIAIPNGGHRNVATAARLKAEGVSAGVPDLFIPEWQLWVEMKRVKNGRLSPGQKDWINYLNSIGHTALVCNGAEDAIKKITDFYNDKITKNVWGDC